MQLKADCVLRKGAWGWQDLGANKNKSKNKNKNKTKKSTSTTDEKLLLS
jgi:hypothetical protein